MAFALHAADLRSARRAPWTALSVICTYIPSLDILTGCGGVRQIESLLTKSDGLLHDRKVVPHTQSCRDKPNALEVVISAELLQLHGYRQDAKYK